MHREVIFDLDDPVGYCFDHSRASREGLYEELRMWVLVPNSPLEPSAYELRLTEEQVEAIQQVLDLGTNVPPGTPQTVSLRVEYVYNYGEVPAHAV